MALDLSSFASAETWHKETWELKLWVQGPWTWAPGVRGSAVVWLGCVLRGTDVTVDGDQLDSVVRGDRTPPGVGARVARGDGGWGSREAVAS